MKTKSTIKIAVSVCLLAVVGGVQAALPLDPLTITKYRDPLPIPPKLTASSLTITSSEFTQQVLPSDFNAGPYQGKTAVWGYNSSYPGPTIDVTRGTPITVKWVNNLGNATLYTPASSTVPGILPVDQSLHWADPLGDMSMGGGSHILSTYSGPVPMVTHLHGALIESKSDGHPDDSFTPALSSGKTYEYSNNQEAATLWYHDHALGVTRLNVYAGLAGIYLLRDNVENALKLPGNAADNPKYEREILIQDKSFDSDGQLVFPNAGVNPSVHPFWQPEFFGDTIVVNGKAWPYLDVEPRRYRFRLLNGSNARFYTLSFGQGLPFWQIGTDGGLLDTPVKVSELTIAPGERADVIVDFASVAGSTFILNNTGKAPSPRGKPVDPKTTGQIMQFRVGTTVTTADTTFNPDSVPTPSLRGANSIVRLNNVAPVKTRTMTLNEVQGPGGPLEVLLDGKKWSDTISETPKEGTTEIWEIVNVSADVHPIHIHLVPFQLLSRQKFRVTSYLSAYDARTPGSPALNPAPYLIGKPAPADANEYGWKDTVKMNPGEVTRIAIRFAPTEIPANILNATFPFDPSQGPGFVWHCHILDHEDNEMMRPYKVIPLPR